MVRTLSIAAIATCLTMAACTSGPSWDQPGRSTSTPKQTDNVTAGPNDGSVVSNDMTFVSNASGGGSYEVQSSQLALQKTQSDRVRMIAQHMIRDHTQANQQLTMITQKKGMQATESLSSDQQQMLDKLKALSGPSFDSEYLAQQKMAHEQTIAIFKKESMDGTDADLKMFATNTLPTLQNHLQMVSGSDNNMTMEQK